MYVCAQEERDDNITGCFKALKATNQDKMQNLLLPSSTGIESQNPKYANWSFSYLPLGSPLKMIHEYQI